jgi:phosphoribosylformylglycinamidine synthase
MGRLTSEAKVTIVRFPGSNCDQDCYDATSRELGLKTTFCWHTDQELPASDVVLLPGGFSFGDYLRSGALASHSPIMSAVKKFAQAGGYVIGICNGFQILTEAHLLPGALLRNAPKQFICRQIALEGSGRFQTKAPLQMPVAHGEGRYFIAAEELQRLKDNGQIAYRYIGLAGSNDGNPNGSLDGIAGIVSENGRVLGMMPHPERAMRQMTGGSGDGRQVFQAFFE